VSQAREAAWGGLARFGAGLAWHAGAATDTRGGASKEKARRLPGFAEGRRPRAGPSPHERWPLTSLVISNMSAFDLPKISFSFGSALMTRFWAGSCSLFFLM